MGYIGRGPVKSGAFRIIDDVSSGFDGSDVTFTLQSSSSNITPGTEQNLLIAVDGVIQEPVDAFTISGSVLTFTSAPASGASFWGVEFGDVGGVASTVANGTVGTTGLADDAVTAAKLANSINTEITANTAKVTNATHTGDVTGATALTIAAGSVDIAHLSASGSASSSTFLAGNNAWAAAGGGKIGQVVQIVKNTVFTTNTTAFNSSSDITGLAVNITPSANSSKILVHFALSGSQSVEANRMQYRLVRTISGGSDTAIFVGDVTSTNRTPATGGISSAHNSILASTSGGVYLDDPGSTTSQITYKLQAKQQDAAGTGTYVYVNRTSTSWNNDAAAVVSASSIVVMEVLA